MRPVGLTGERLRELSGLRVNLLSFRRTDRDMRRIVTLVTLRHGRLYRPRRR